MNKLFYGDNLEVLRSFADEQVDLIYLDPPFNSNAGYNVLFRATASRSTARGTAGAPHHDQQRHSG